LVERTTPGVVRDVEGERQAARPRAVPAEKEGIGWRQLSSARLTKPPNVGVSPSS
jgi:hypothetical protein